MHVLYSVHIIQYIHRHEFFSQLAPHFRPLVVQIYLIVSLNSDIQNLLLILSVSFFLLLAQQIHFNFQFDAQYFLIV